VTYLAINYGNEQLLDPPAADQHAAGDWPANGINNANGADAKHLSRARMEAGLRQKQTVQTDDSFQILRPAVDRLGCSPRRGPGSFIHGVHVIQGRCPGRQTPPRRRRRQPLILIVDLYRYSPHSGYSFILAKENGAKIFW